MLGKGYITSISELLLFSGLLFFPPLLCSSSCPNPYSLLLCSQALRMWHSRMQVWPSCQPGARGPSKQPRRTCWTTAATALGDFLLSLELGARFFCVALLGSIWLSFLKQRQGRRVGNAEAAPDQRAWPRTSRSDLLRLAAPAPTVPLVETFSSACRPALCNE